MAEPAGKHWCSGAPRASRSWFGPWLRPALRAVLVVSSSLAGVASSSAVAQATESKPSVLLVVPDVEPTGSMRTLQRVLVGRLSELGVAVRLSTAPFAPPRSHDLAQSPRDVLAFIWLDRQPDSIAVHFYEAAGTHLRERRIPVADINAADINAADINAADINAADINAADINAADINASSIEEVAIVVRSAVSALLERSRRSAGGGDVNLQEAPRAAAGEPAFEGAGGAAARDTHRGDGGDGPDRSGVGDDAGLRLSLGYVAQDYAPALRWNHGVALGLAWQGWFSGASLGLSYSWVAPIALRSEQLEVRLLRHPSELILGWEVPLQESWLRLRPEAALGVDAVARQTKSRSEGVEEAASQRRWVWSASGRLALVLAPLPRWQAFVAAGADYLLNQFTYNVAGEGGGPLIEPRRFRPVFQCGVAIELP